MLPVRFIAEALNAKVNWNGETRTIRLERDEDLGAPPLPPGASVKEDGSLILPDGTILRRREQPSADGTLSPPSTGFPSFPEQRPPLPVGGQQLEDGHRRTAAYFSRMERQSRLNK